MFHDSCFKGYCKCCEFGDGVQGGKGGETEEGMDLNIRVQYIKVYLDTLKMRKRIYIN